LTGVSTAPTVARASATTAVPPGEIRRGWAGAPVAMVGVAAVGLALFFGSLPGVDVRTVNGLGLLSVLPAGAVVGVVLVTGAFIMGLAQTTPHRVALGFVLAGLVVCLSGVTAVVEANPRFPTAYQIVGYVDYVSRTGHAPTSLAAYFSWPGFFAIVSFLTGAAGTGGILTLVRIWPVVIDLFCLPPLFLLMRGLRIPWRARWLAGFLFVVGNWVGQDYFSPQSFGFLLYLLFVAILVNWFTGPGRRPLRVLSGGRMARLHGRLFGTLRAGELPARPAGTAERTFLLVLLVGLFAVATVSHQLTPIFMIGACGGMVVVRRCRLTSLPVLLVVIVAGYISFATEGYWSGHLSNILGGIGTLGFNVTSSVSGRLSGSSSTHLVALHAREAMALVMVALAVFGALRRRHRGWDDRVLLVLLVAPVVLIGAASYGGEIALRTYLFMLPAAAVMAALVFFPDESAGLPSGRRLAGLGACALLLPVGFFLARYGNEAFEQVPTGELAATNWVYAHDGGGVRLLWLSTAPTIDVTPQMPWAYKDLTKVEYVPTQAPRDPTAVGRLVSSLRHDGPGSYLIATDTQEAAMEETAGYTDDWGPRFRASMATEPGVTVVFTSATADVYAVRSAPGTARRPLAAAGTPTRSPYGWTGLGVIALGLLIVVLGAVEVVRLSLPAPALVMRRLWWLSVPLTAVLVADIILRFAVLS
jgi:hypothetical protein